MFELRPYQQQCVDAIWSNLDKHCVASLPTGSGKTPVAAELIRRFMEYPDTRVLLLTHKRELIRQNASALARHLPDTIEVGIFCAGLRSKEIKPVTIASVQSLVNAKELPPYDIILIDECHLIPHGEDGQYHELFTRLPDARIIGLTATPFRLDSGLLHKGDDALFEALVYEAKTGDLIDQGWLSPIVAKSVSEQADLSDVHLRGKEYIPGEMATALDKENITAAAIKDVISRASDRKSILIFCAGVEHAKHVQAAFALAGQTSIATVTESTSMHDRDDATNRFKNGTLKILINVGVYTTGFDAPNVDCIVLLRATQSPGLYVQCVGRGLRKAEGKKDCLLLDYGGNVARFGPLDFITAQRVSSGVGAAPTKTCSQCGSIIFSGLKECPDCGFLFPAQPREAPKHDTQASELDPIHRATKVTEYQVNSVSYELHTSKAGNRMLRVDYHIGIYNIFSEYIMPENIGYPQQKAQAWFARRGISPMPRTVTEALQEAPFLPIPTKITVKEGGKYPEIVSCSGWHTSDLPF